MKPKKKKKKENNSIEYRHIRHITQFLEYAL